MAEYSKPSDHPVQNPILTGVLAQIVAAESAAEGRRETAFPTLVRYSDAGKCARAIALERLLPEADTELDVAGEFRMWLGRMIHEHVQAAIIETYGGVAEQTSCLGLAQNAAVETSPGQITVATLAAGHADWVGIIAGTDLGKICFELKTVGAYAFDQSIGLKRRSYSRENPSGPKAAAKIQGALNAVANDCDTLIIGYVSMEAVSIQLADKVNLGMMDRICAEWHYTRAEFSPWAESELQRAQMIDECFTSGFLAPRHAVGDEFENIVLTPEKVNETGQPKAWQCVYCRCREACVKIGPDPVSLSEIEAYTC